MLAFTLSCLISIYFAPLVIDFYKRKQWLDDPQSRRHVKVTHQEAVPRGGGLIIFVPILISAIAFLHFDKYLLAILIGALLLTIVGVLDDIYDINPFIRLGTGFLAALIVVGSGIGIAYVTNPFGPGVIHLNQPQLAFYLLGKTRTIWILADLFALIFILWNMNIVNWAKGVDGQLPGFISISLIFITMLASRFAGDPTQFNTATLGLIVAGAFAGLLFWNFYPQRMMPGYGAGSLAGYFLSVLAILSGAKVATTLMVLSLPTADGIFTIMRRIRAGKSPFWGDRGHLHHKLMDVFGWGRRKIAIFYWAWSLSMGLLSLYLNSVGKIVAISIAILFVFGLQIFAKMKSTQMKPN